MNWVSGSLVYIILWVVFFFMTLPWGNKIPNVTQKGCVESAPNNPRIGLKIRITTGLAGLGWIIFYMIRRVYN